MLGLTPRKSSDRYKYPGVRSSSSGLGSRKKSQSGDVIMSTTYFQMDDHTVKTSESQEHLRVGDDRQVKATDGVNGQVRMGRSVSGGTAEV